MSVDATGTVTSVAGAIRQAAQRTGANFNYLLATARVESNLNPSARATSSSAGGLFQFLEQTWLATLKHAGPSLGYGQYADAITVNAAGRYEVQDSRLRQQILDLRNDPNANALMAGAFTRWNGDWLTATLNRAPSEGELYLAHFLGAQGAAKLIGLAQSSPQANAAEVFPRAAGANRPIFYDKQGEPRSVAQVYNLMVGRYSVARGQAPGNPSPVVAQTNAPASAVATNAPAKSTAPWLAAPPPGASPPVGVAIPAAAKDNGPVFYGLFHVSDRPDAVAPVVTSLWTNTNPNPAPAPPKNAPANPTPPLRGGMFDLFRVDG